MTADDMGMSDRYRSGLWSLLMAVLLVTGCASTGNSEKNLPEQVASEQAGDYRIGVDDQIQVNVWGNPELSVSVPVRPDGKISMPLIGDVQAGGLTPEEVAESITVELSSFMRDPSVTVLLTALRSHQYLSRIRVTGAVNRPLSIPFRQGMTVLDAILEAGGVNDFASANKTKLHRNTEQGPQVYDIPLGKILKGGDLSSNVKLTPGDTITVPERLF